MLPCWDCSIGFCCFVDGGIGGKWRIERMREKARGKESQKMISCLGEFSARREGK